MNQEHSIERLPLKNKQIACVDCGSHFIFSPGEQRYFLSKGLSEPKRCPECRPEPKGVIDNDSAVS